MSRSQSRPQVIREMVNSNLSFLGRFDVVCGSRIVADGFVAMPTNHASALLRRTAGNARSYLPGWFIERSRWKSENPLLGVRVFGRGFRFAGTDIGGKLVSQRAAPRNTPS